MTIIPEHDTRSPYPFQRSKRDYDLAIQNIPTRDLRAEVEAAQWLALDVAGNPGSRAVAEIQLTGLIDELERRKRLWTLTASDPVRPAWPRRDHGLKARVEAVKTAWPIERYCADALGAHLRRCGRDRLKACCPLPGHDDRSPSFVVYLATDSAWCHGCNRGGDVIALTGYAFGHERFYDRLEHLERLSGIAYRGAA